MDRIRVLVVDDHPIFRRGVLELLESQADLEIVAEATDGLEAIRKARETEPDVILMDLDMPRCGGLEATAALQTELPQIKVLILTISDAEADLFAAIKAGARGYVLKNAAPEELIQNINHIAQGEAAVSPSMAAKLLNEFRETGNYTIRKEAKPVQSDAAPLTVREMEVLEQVAQGASNKEIASELFITENTVKTHLKNILEKLHLRSRSQAAAYAARLGLIPPGES